MKPLLPILALLLVVVSAGCVQTGCKEYKEINKCIEYVEVDEPCLSHIIHHAPPNFTTKTIKTTVYYDEICYDVLKDPNKVRQKVDRIFEEHPDDWNRYMDWTPDEKDPMILVQIDNETEEFWEEKVYNYTKKVRKCIDNETRMVCAQ